ncbi:MAG: hypothetical protein HQM15_04180 [Deltaproteobacteria bacterium]|nr:hypothetical protein [Deltaproteobacteria bacterium]
MPTTINTRPPSTTPVNNNQDLSIDPQTVGPGTTPSNGVDPSSPDSIGTDFQSRLNAMGQGTQGSGTSDSELLSIANDFAPDSSGVVDFSNDPGQAATTDTQTQIADLKKQVTASKLPATEKTDLLNKLQKAKASLDLKQNDQANTLLSDATDSFNKIKDLPESVFKLAETTKTSLSDLVAKAGDAGIDLQNLPKTPDDNVLSFVTSLTKADTDIDAYKAKQDLRTNNMKTLKQTLDQQTSDWYSNSETPPKLADAQKSVSYFKREDDDFKAMDGVVSTMRDKVSGALSALGYQVETPKEGPKNQISIGGKLQDFFNYNDATFKLSTNHTDLTQNPADFSAMPCNRDMQGGGVGSILGSIFTLGQGGEDGWTDTRHDPDGVKVRNGNYLDLVKDSPGYPTSLHGDGSINY